MYAVISDVHSNFEALSAVLEEIERLCIKDIICAGDIIGYGPSPEECIDALFGRNFHSVLGNHDALVTGRLERCVVNDCALKCADLNDAAMSQDKKRHLKKLKPSMVLDDMLVVHGKPIDDFIYYIHYNDDASRSFLDFDHRLCVIGHTHVPSVFAYAGNASLRVSGDFVELKDGFRYILNPGSVGQPRDSDARASFGVLGDDYFKINRVHYDVDSTVKKLKDNCYPEFVYERLKGGF